MLAYEFMQRAILIGFMLSIMLPIVGVIMINRKTSMVGDALSHTSLAGVGIGLILGWNPIVGALLACILSSFTIEKIRMRFPAFGDMPTAIVMSTGLGLAAILSDFTPGGVAFDDYLFGSITSVRNSDLVLVGSIFVVVIIASILLYTALLSISINPDMAKISGVPVKTTNRIFTLITAISIAASCKIVGALMVTSLLILPVACALLLGNSYKSVYIISLVLAIIDVQGGIAASYYLGYKSGGAIVMIAVFGFLTVAIIKHLLRYRLAKKDKVLIEKQ